VSPVTKSGYTITYTGANATNTATCVAAVVTASGNYFMDAAPVAKAGYDAMRAGRINVIPGVGTKIMRVMTALSPSRRFTAELSGRFVSRH